MNDPDSRAMKSTCSGTIIIMLVHQHGGRRARLWENKNSKNRTQSLKASKMNGKVLITTTPSRWPSISDSKQPLKLQTHLCPPNVRILCSSSSSSSPDLPVTEKLGNDASTTGGAYDFERATTSLTQKLISSPKKVTLVRHGLSSWNKESRIQGSSNLSILTETGVTQAERCRKALADIYFDQCFSSPISRAKSTAEVIWKGREEPLVFLDSLEEAHLYFLEGMKNVDARQRYPKEYRTWREDPCNFSVNGVYPIRKLWEVASEAWKEILFTPGENFLVVTHKSMLRALICTALGLGPERFRAIDVNNGGISVFNFNRQGEAMLQSLNMTAHMYSDHAYRY